jgi:hypothetical protein
MKLSFALVLACAPLASAQTCAGISNKDCKNIEGCTVDKGSCVSTAPACVSGSGTSNARLGYTDDPTKFNIALDLDVQDGLQTAYINAKARWEEIVVGDMPGGGPGGLGAAGLYQCSGGYPRTLDGTNTLLDDLYICGKDACIDGPGGILGRAFTAYTRGDGTTLAGYMEFDQEDIPAFSAELWETVILHEMGHVLGVGLRWAGLGLVRQRGPVSQYLGAAGVAAWNAMGCTGNPPVETDGAEGTRGVHWDEECLVNELMTGYVNFGVVNPLSALTAASLQDIGYSVDMTAADFVDAPNEWLCCQGRRLGHTRSLIAGENGFINGNRPVVPPGLEAKARAYGLETLAEAKANKPASTPDGVNYVADQAVTIYVSDDDGNIFGVDVSA